MLSDEERLFRDTVARFAKERLGPHVRAMDEAGQFRPELLRELFELGLMGIGIAEEYGGQSGTFFQAGARHRGVGQSRSRRFRDRRCPEHASE